MFRNIYLYINTYMYITIINLKGSNENLKECKRKGPCWSSKIKKKIEKFCSFITISKIKEIIF